MQTLIVLLLIYGAVAQRRLCEAEGTCRQCADTRYSYYRCTQQEDCFLGEICDRGFCCPNIRPIVGLQSEIQRFTQHSTNEQMLLNTHKPENSDIIEDKLCPDGSESTKRCRLDDECVAVNELCFEGKCCASEFKFYL
ncbi:hypothetical protein DICVIV_04189 [Dictyocaulus viviparus]|uniref:Uncharacterized protein n=1 Tax=Dictyocaulus viviparus TaxID=29172 RepID=A0A0D8Y0R6_DICVI|nr:hypothetical protein DICVIV_04189 [Dictyocaulus viviparus]